MPWIILVPGIPFALALVVLQVLGPEQGPGVGLASLTEGHLPGLIIFCTAAVAQVAVCLGAIYVFAQVLLRTPAEVRRRRLLVGVPFGLAILLALALLPYHGGAAGRLSFRLFRRHLCPVQRRMAERGRCGLAPIAPCFLPTTCRAPLACLPLSPRQWP